MPAVMPVINQHARTGAAPQAESADARIARLRQLCVTAIGKKDYLAASKHADALDVEFRTLRREAIDKCQDATANKDQFDRARMLDGHYKQLQILRKDIRDKARAAACAKPQAAAPAQPAKPIQPVKPVQVVQPPRRVPAAVLPVRAATPSALLPRTRPTDVRAPQTAPIQSDVGQIGLGAVKPGLTADRARRPTTAPRSVRARAFRLPRGRTLLGGGISVAILVGAWFGLRPMESRNNVPPIQNTQSFKEKFNGPAPVIAPAPAPGSSAPMEPKRIHVISVPPDVAISQPPQPPAQAPTTRAPAAASAPTLPYYVQMPGSENFSGLPTMQPVDTAQGMMSLYEMHPVRPAAPATGNGSETSRDIPEIPGYGNANIPNVGAPLPGGHAAREGMVVSARFQPHGKMMCQLHSRARACIEAVEKPPESEQTFWQKLFGENPSRPAGRTVERFPTPPEG